MKRRIRVVSNGVGEDTIGVTLASAVDNDQFDVLPCPLVGKGSPYKNNGFSPVFDQDFLPSGGFLRGPLAILKIYPQDC